MSNTEAIIQGIKQERNRYTVDVSDKKIQMPEAYSKWRQPLEFRFQSTSHQIDPSLLLDKGTKPEKLSIGAKVSQDGIYITDSARKEPGAPHANLQLCKIQTDRFGQVTNVTLSVDKAEFFDYMRALTPHSSLFSKLAAIQLPESFPNGRPDFSYFMAHAQVLSEKAKAIMDGGVESLAVPPKNNGRII